MRKLLALAAFALAAACAPSTAPTPAAEPAAVPAPVVAPVPEAPPAAQIADEASCKIAGGDWRPICRMQTLSCVITYPDAGKACTDGDDCAGNCEGAVTGAAGAGQPATGVCSTNSDPCGCHTFIEDGKATATLCAD